LYKTPATEDSLFFKDKKNEKGKKEGEDLVFSFVESLSQ